MRVCFEEAQELLAVHEPQMCWLYWNFHYITKHPELVQTRYRQKSTQQCRVFNLVNHSTGTTIKAQCCCLIITVIAAVNGNGHWIGRTSAICTFKGKIGCLSICRQFNASNPTIIILVVDLNTYKFVKALIYNNISFRVNPREVYWEISLTAVNQDIQVPITKISQPSGDQEAKLWWWNKYESMRDENEKNTVQICNDWYFCLCIILPHIYTHKQ